MRLGVGVVRKLARNKAACVFGSDLLRLLNSALHSLDALCQNDLCAISLQQVSALNAHGFGHGEDHLIASRGSYGGKTDARVAAGRLYDN